MRFTFYAWPAAAAVVLISTGLGWTADLKRETRDELIRSMQNDSNYVALAPEPVDELRHHVAEIHPGMAREEVEEYFTRDDGPQNTSQTRYYHPAGYAVVVSYDQTGGAWSPHNHVVDKVTMLRVPKRAVN